MSEFGSALVESGDLDPIYLMLRASKMDPDTTKRWCLAYWMFYHAGVACRIAEQPASRFWPTCWQAQEEKWPRGTERRHFKAENSRKSMSFLQGYYRTAEAAVDHVSSADSPADLRLRRIIYKAQNWTGFGPWIAFKIADMVDAVLGVPVDFSEAYDLFFDDPVVGAVIVTSSGNIDHNDSAELVRNAKEIVKQSSTQTRATYCADAVNLLKAGGLGTLRSPVADRPLAVQEYETVLCKYKSHLSGHYPAAGHDTREILKGLDGWGDLAGSLRIVLATRTRLN